MISVNGLSGSFGVRTCPVHVLCGISFQLNIGLEN